MKNPILKARFFCNPRIRMGFLLFLLMGVAGIGCATSDEARLKESRDAYLAGDLPHSEAALFTPEVFDNTQNRLAHFSKLSSVAFSEGQYEKAIYFLNKARDASNNNRAETGFTWLLSGDYRGNPLEYSYLHFYLIMAYELLADAGKSPAWSMAEIKDKKGVVLVQGESIPAHTYSAKEISDLRQKARAELLAWDTHLQNLRNTFPDKNYYKEDLLARTMASYVHASSADNADRRTGELLAQDALKVLQKEFVRYPSHVHEDAKIQDLESKLQARAQGKNSSPSTFLVMEAGVVDPYKVKRFHLGMTTIFGHIQNPGLRSAMENVGLQVIFNTAPEFGLIVAAGGVAGAIGSAASDDDEDQVHYFSEAVDRSLGFEIRFPMMQLPPTDTEVKLNLSQNGKPLPEIQLPLLAPLQEMIATEIKSREKGDMFQRALKIGSEYAAVLIPAIVAYRNAQKNNNIFQKLAIVAGFYLAKKAIDNANNPDLRSWDYLPKLIAGNLITVTPGDYQARVRIENRHGQVDRDLGTLRLGDPNQWLLFRNLGDLPLLKSVKGDPHPLR